MTIHALCSEDILQSCVKKFADVVRSCNGQFCESVIDAYQQDLRAQVSLIFLESLAKCIEKYADCILEVDHHSSMDIETREWRIFLNTDSSEDRRPEQVFQLIDAAMKNMIRSSAVLLERKLSAHELNITCQKLENIIENKMNRVQLMFMSNSFKSSYRSSFSPGIINPSLPDSTRGNASYKRCGATEIDHKTSFAAMGEIFNHPQTTPLTADSTMSIPVTKRLHMVQSMAASSHQDTSMDESHKELHERKASLDTLLSRSKSLCKCLSKSVEESLGCPVEHLCLQEGFHHLISDLREQLWILESWTDQLRQELLGVER